MESVRAPIGQVQGTALYLETHMALLITELNDLISIHESSNSYLASTIKFLA